MTKKKSHALTAVSTTLNHDLAEKFQQAKKQKNDIRSFVEEFIVQFVSIQTKRAYSKDLQFFFDFLKSGGQVLTSPSDINAIHFRLYRDHLMDNKYTSATVNRRLVCIRSFIKWAMACRYLDHNPLDQIKLPKTQTENPTIAFTDEEVLRMIGAPLTQTKIGLSHRLMMVLLFSLGLRRSELVNIKIKDFYRERGHLVLKIRGKGDKLRDMPIPNQVSREIRYYIESMETYRIYLGQEDYLIQSQKIGKNTKPMDGSTVFRVIGKYARECGIDKRVSPHSCRATAISHLLDTQKTPIRDVAIFAGHAKITTTERYDKRRKGLDENPAYAINYGELDDLKKDAS
ncbi:MAG: tyrosine-type recombinase/integrase [Bacteriovoracaceae bacterium]|nr:tyrosine-type recombinase/integrase [Bacteriovoracaceae bacterium]